MNVPVPRGEQAHGASSRRIYSIRSLLQECCSNTVPGAIKKAVPGLVGWEPANAAGGNLGFRAYSG